MKSQIYGILLYFIFESDHSFQHQLSRCDETVQIFDEMKHDRKSDSTLASSIWIVNSKDVSFLQKTI